MRLERLRRAFSTLIRAWRKLVVDPRRYASDEGYRSADYWRDRLGRSGGSLTGPGHEGWTEERNRAMYDAARSVLGQELDALGAGGPSDSVLEIGPGTGYWTQMCMERGITHLTAVDITDVRFPDLKQRYPGYEFIAADACHEVPEGPFSLILLLDVIEHIVTEQGLRSLLGNLERAAQANGLIAISFPPPALGRHDLYYLRFWPTGHVVQLLGHSVLVREVPFRDGTLLLFRRGGGAGTGEAG